MKKLLCLAAALAVGCATQMTLQEALPIARNSPDLELCYVAISGRGQQALRQAVNQVMSERSTNCNQHAATVQARMAQDAANNAAQLQTGLMLMQAGRPQAAPMPRTTHCRSVWIGNGYNTVCD